MSLIAGRPSRAVWQNAVGGLTFFVDGDEGHYIKWLPHGSHADVAREVERLQWASAYVTVPVVVESGRDVDGSWMVTRALKGRSAVDNIWRAHPQQAVKAVGVGLRLLHDTLPVASCPYSWRVSERLARAQEKLTTSGLDVANLHDEHQTFSTHSALEFLNEEPPLEDLVVCHGDACAPNTLLSDDGHFLAHVDLGNLGVGDRWADLAVASWSTQWNYGPGFDDVLYDAYGIEADDEKISYYRLLWDLDA